MKFAGNPTGKPVFASVPSHMDVHGCRREYANAMYHRYQEKLWENRRKGFPQPAAHIRIKAGAETRRSYLKSRTGAASKRGSSRPSFTIGAGRTGGVVVYDKKKVMLYVSRQLGHNRISVIAGYYLGK